MSHLEIAAKKGMKQGFNAYMDTLRKSGLANAQATLDTLDAMSSRQAFAWYCAKHGPDVTAISSELVSEPTRNVAPVAGTTIRIAGKRERIPTGLASEIAQARARLAELEAQASKPKQRKRTSRKSTPAEVQENLWRPWAIAKHGIPAKVGATFAYKGKRRTSTFKVTRVTDEGVYSVRVA